jgi:hypothetical protein
MLQEDKRVRRESSQEGTSHAMRAPAEPVTIAGTPEPGASFSKRETRK